MSSIQLPLPFPQATIEILLTQGYIAIVDYEDRDLAEGKWHYLNGYAAMRKNKQTIPMHRVILSRLLGRALMPGEIVDHANMDKLDNRRSNLRLATRSQNQQNKRKTKSNSSGFKGVYWSTGMHRWRATIRLNRKTVILGYFDTPEEAHEAYCKAGREHFGEFFNPG